MNRPTPGQTAAGRYAYREAVQEAGMSQTDHAAALGALADPIRVAILRALWEAEDHRASFSAIREAADIDDSGKFNYHLGQLTDEFVTKTPEDDYRLRRAGIDVVGSLIAGTYDYGGEIGPVSFDEPCPVCDSPTTLSYDGELISVQCSNDDSREETLVAVPAPPSVLGGADEDELADVARRYFRSTVAELRAGFCYHCESPTTLQIGSSQQLMDGDTPEDIQTNPLLQSNCAACGETIITDLGVALAEHPAIVSFFHGRGRDVRSEPLLGLLAAGDDRSVITSEQPPKARLCYTVGDDTIEVHVDETLTVTEVTTDGGESG